MATSERVLLPSYLVPTRYDLTINPDLVNFTFTGVTKIEFDVDTAQLNDDNANEIILHARELCFESAEYSAVTDDASTAAPPVKADEIHVSLKDHSVKFVFGAPLDKATCKKIVMTVNYTGFLNNQMAGFYRSSYDNIDGEKKIMASSQFEPLDARRTFPCVDEPAVKAVFGVTMTIPSNLQCFSNMPESSVVSLSSTEKTITFLDTPKMSTYLLAFCVGEFDCVQSKTSHGVMVKVYTPPGKSASGTFALETACRCLDLYDDFFQIPYPLPKLDMVAIPEFAAGAMENWGLVTYREVDLLIDPVTASSQQKQRVAVVVNHELAHQWFGNLVTMQWWSSLWLNESFASWCENYATDTLFPQYSMWEQFTTDHYLSAVRLDSLKSSHPIEVPIRHAEEVEQVFDAISYCKGASVIRMIQNVLGMKNFQSGLVAYMRKHAFGNTEPSDLWTAWEEASKMPIGELMVSWTEQMGFPLLRVTKEDFQGDKVVLEVTQSWFLSDGSEPDDEEGRAKKWTIPVLTCTDAGPHEDMTLMREKTGTITVPLSSANGWVKLNAGNVVPMRVLPSDEMLKRMAGAVQSKALPPIDRADLLSDGYALVKAGHMSPESLLRLLGSYKDEDNFIVWGCISDVLTGLDTVLMDDDAMSASLVQFAKRVVLNLMEKIGWEAKETDGHLTTLLRAMMVGLVSRFAHDDPRVVKEATTRFKAFQEDATDVKSLPADLRTPVFKIVLKNGGAEVYEWIKAYYYKASDNAERKHVLSTLGYTPDAKLKIATMDWTTSGEVRLQDFFYAMGSVRGSGKEGRDISWAYFQDNFDKLHGMVGDAIPSLMAACVVTCAGGFCSNEKADEIEKYFEAHPLPKVTRKISQTLENMRANAKFCAILQASELSKPAFWSSLA